MAKVISKNGEKLSTPISLPRKYIQLKRGFEKATACSINTIRDLYRSECSKYVSHC